MRVKRHLFDKLATIIPILFLLFIETASALKAGASKAEITPELGTPLNGYGARLGKGALAVHDPLWARVLYLQTEDLELYLISLDLCIIDRELREKVISMAPENIPPQHIILCATHTHNGFGGMCRDYPLRFVSGRYIPELVVNTARLISQAMKDAKEHARNAVLGYGTLTQTDLTCNRRYSGGPFDPQIGFIVVEDANGNEIAIVANLSAHPTSIGEEDFYSFSADYPGFFYAEIEKLLSPHCVAIFLNGAEGNQTIQAPNNTSGWARTAIVGQLLAQRIVAQLHKVTLTDAKLTIRHKEVALPHTIAPFFPHTITLTALIVNENELAINFFPGELCVEYALKLREETNKAGIKHHFTVGLANDYLLYFTPKNLLFDNTYEAGMHCFGPQAEHWVLQHCLSLLNIEFPPIPKPNVETTKSKTMNHLQIVEMNGSAYDIGYIRGQLAKQSIEQRFDEFIRKPAQTGKIVPKDGLLSILPLSWLDCSHLLIPILAISTRPWAKQLHPLTLNEFIGISDGAETSFDQVWLLQNALAISSATDLSPLFDTPLCISLAIFGERAGAKHIILAHNADWRLNDLPTTYLCQTEEGFNYLEIGFPWFAGLICGMNEAGITLSVTYDNQTPADLAQNPLIPCLTTKHILKTCKTFEDAKTELTAISCPPGWSILLGGKNKAEQWEVCIFPESNPVEPMKLTQNGIVTAISSTPSPNETLKKRYETVMQQLESERIINPQELIHTLTDFSRPEHSSQPWNELTRFSAVFIPSEGKVYITAKQPDGKPDQPVLLQLTE